jgi:hypothetical protein
MIIGLLENAIKRGQKHITDKITTGGHQMSPILPNKD